MQIHCVGDCLGDFIPITWSVTRRVWKSQHHAIYACNGLPCASLYETAQWNKAVFWTR